MEVNVRTTTTRTITLNEEECKYLANITQNYIGEEIEPEDQVIIRHALFKAATDMGTTKGQL